MCSSDLIAVEEAWREQIEQALKSPLLSAEAIAYVHDVMIDSTLPTEAYDTVVTVMRAAAEQHWAPDEVNSILRFSLSPDTATASPVALITASAEPDDEPPDPLDLTAAGSPATALSKARKARKALKHAKEVAARSATVNTLAEKAATAGVSYAGQTWWERMRLDARNAVTGLDGHLTQTVLDAFVQQNEGSETKKRWVTKRDSRVRDSHHEADGQTVPIDHVFIVGNSLLMYPGDRRAPVEETANCRCVMVAVGPRLRDEKGRFKALPGLAESRAERIGRARKAAGS